jgi:DNA-binding MarR family transcriptional regulator
MPPNHHTSRRPPAAAAAAPADRAATDGAAELADLLTFASRRLRRGTADLLAPLGLTVSQARVLRIVADGPPLRMAELADRLDVVPRSATSMVDALEAAGFVARDNDPADRRSVRVRLTARGRRLVEQLHAARHHGAEELFAALGPRDRSELTRLLGVVCHDYRGAPCGRHGGRNETTDGATAGGAR